jgi:hypothetical protein
VLGFCTNGILIPTSALGRIAACIGCSAPAKAIENIAVEIRIINLSFKT